MKNFVLILALMVVALYFACNGAHNKTGGESRDSAASHGNSGPVDTSKSAHSSSAGAATSDTSHTGKGTTAPSVDSGKHN